MRAVRVLPAIVALSVLALAAGTQERAQPARPGAQAEPRVERVRRHWVDRAEGERRELDNRLTELEELPEEQRHEILARARALREAEHALRDAMPRELRRELEELQPEQGRERWRRHVRDCLRERGRTLREHLPHTLRERLERGPLETRRHVQHDLERGRERMGRHELERLARELGVAPGPVRRPAELSRAARQRFLRELERTAAPRSGRPGTSE
jgi:hypothetical protein